MTTPGAAPPQLSPDGHWWWDGTQWQPASDAAKAQVAAQAAQQAQAHQQAHQQVQAHQQAQVPMQAVPAQVVPESQPVAAAQAMPFASVLPAQAQPSGRSLPGGPKALIVVAVVAVLGVLAAAYVFLLGGSDEPTTPAAPRVTAPVQPKVLSLEELGKAVNEAATAQMAYSVDNNRFTTRMADLIETGYQPTPGARITIRSVSRSTFCLSGTSGGRTVFFEARSGLSLRPCR